jgi:site-specific DNA-methyltransferase (adenine-specific)
VIGNATLYLGDNLPFLRSCGDGEFDVAIVDPPYTTKFIISSGDKCAKVNRSYNLESLNSKVPSERYFKELKRISKNQIIWGVNYYEYYLGAGRIVWDKDNTGDYSDCELAYHSFSNVTRLVKIRWNGMLQQDMKNKQKRIHPTEKPYQLYKWLLQNYAKEGDKILDTHLGSMSSVIACIEYGYHITGCELDKDYFKSGIKRVKEYESQLKIFS